MNAPRDLMLAGVLPRVFPKKSELDTRIILFLGHLSGQMTERNLYEELLLESQIWKEAVDLPFNAGSTYPVEIMHEEADSYRAVIWSLYPAFQDPQRGGKQMSPYRLLVFSTPYRLLSWKRQHASQAQRFSVHTALETPKGQLIKDAVLLALYSNG